MSLNYMVPGDWYSDFWLSLIRRPLLVFFSFARELQVWKCQVSGGVWEHDPGNHWSSHQGPYESGVFWEVGQTLFLF